jgi:hypothetical protein
MNLHNSGNLDAWVPVIHAVEPRVDRDPRFKDNKKKAYSSVYFEPGRDEGGDEGDDSHLPVHGMLSLLTERGAGGSREPARRPSVAAPGSRRGEG